jgi:hypothetical protein
MALLGWCIVKGSHDLDMLEAMFYTHIVIYKQPEYIMFIQQTN